MRRLLPFVTLLALAAAAPPAGAAPEAPPAPLPEWPCGVDLGGGAHIDAPWLCRVLDQIEP